MTHWRRSLSLFAASATLLVAFVSLRAQGSWLSAPKTIAPGVDYFTSTDQTLADPQGPTSVYLLKLDPVKVRLDKARSRTTRCWARRRSRALRSGRTRSSAVNGGFFNTKTGESAGLSKIAGELISDASVTRGAVAIRSPQSGKTELEFDQISAHMIKVRFTSTGTGARDWLVPISGVDTTRGRGKLMIYTPSYHADTDTAANGTEWVLRGKPLVVREIRVDAGKTPIPRDGVVLSFGGLRLPDDLTALVVGTRVELQTSWHTLNGLPASHLDSADHIVNGAGLLRLSGHEFTDWTVGSAQRSRNLYSHAASAHADRRRRRSPVL